MKYTALFLLSGVIFFGAANGVFALTLQDKQIDIGTVVLTSDIIPDHYYSVFWISDINQHGDPCVFVSGEELLNDYDLSHYGTCFVNDAGTFKIIEHSDFFNGNYIDSLQSEFFVSAETIVIR